MITKNPMQLKAFIKKKAGESHIPAQVVMQNYMLERLLERISLSKYKRLSLMMTLNLLFRILLIFVRSMITTVCAYT